MTTRLENTSAGEIVRTINAERHRIGATATGMVLTLVIVTDEEDCAVKNYQYFDPAKANDPNYNQYWEDFPGTPGMKKDPTSAVCWNAGTDCVDANLDTIYESCVSADKGVLQPILVRTQLTIPGISSSRAISSITSNILLSISRSASRTSLLCSHTVMHAGMRVLRPNGRSLYSSVSMLAMMSSSGWEPRDVRRSHLFFPPVLTLNMLFKSTFTLWKS